MCGPCVDTPRVSLYKCVPTRSLWWEWGFPMTYMLPLRNRLEPQNGGKAGWGNCSIFDVSIISPTYFM